MGLLQLASVSCGRGESPASVTFAGVSHAGVSHAFYTAGQSSTARAQGGGLGGRGGCWGACGSWMRFLPLPCLESTRCSVRSSHPCPACLRCSLAVGRMRAGSFWRSLPSQIVHAFLTLSIHSANRSQGLLCWSPLPVPMRGQPAGVGCLRVIPSSTLGGRPGCWGRCRGEGFP